VVVEEGDLVRVAEMVLAKNGVVGARKMNLPQGVGVKDWK